MYGSNATQPSCRNNLPADINVLHTSFKVRSLGHSLFKRVEVEHNHINRFDPVLHHVRFVLGVAADSEDAAMDLRMQSFHTTIKHLRGEGVFCHILNSEASSTQGLGSAASGEQLDSFAGKELAENFEVALVRHGQEGACHLLRLISNKDVRCEVNWIE
jgi:hypothetical protein